MYADLYQSVMQRFGSSTSAQSMGEWIVANTSIRGRRFSFKGYEFQREIADDMHPDLSVKKCSQIGLALALDTPVPTPTGWTTMGDLEEGDVVFDEGGQPTRVEYVSPIYNDHRCFEVTFDTGEKIVADADHRWFVQSDRPFNDKRFYRGRGRPLKSDGYVKEGVLSTERMASTFKEGKRNIFAIPNTKPLDLPEVSLPVDPYLLGLWLGDGNKHACVLTSHRSDATFYHEELTRRGMVCLPSSERGDSVQFRVHFHDQIKRPGKGKPHSIANELRQLNLLASRKHIPEQYLRASRSQRLDLLRGLLDTDGSITKQGRVSFYNTIPELISGARELAHSLGYKTRTRWRKPSLGVLQNGHEIRSQLHIMELSFAAYSDEPVFLLPRKRERLRQKETSRASEALRRRIVNISEVTTVPVRCISVDSPNHLFLAGEGMIPTHNTEVQIRKFLAILARNTGSAGIFSMPNGPMIKRTYNSRFKPIIDGDSIFNPPGPTPVRRSDQIQIRDSFGYLAGCTEGDATSTSADFLMHDEVDLSPQEMLALYQSRLQNSDMKITQKFSTPTWAGFGIDKSYQMSDQREYLCRCEACNHHQIPLFTPKFVRIPGVDWQVQDFIDLAPEEVIRLDTQGAMVVCENCGRPLDLGNPGLREWVAKFPSRTAFRGYQVRPFSTVRLQPSYIFTQLAKSLNEGTIRRFRNTVLGETHNSSDTQIQRGDIEVCMKGPGTPEVGRDRPIYVGIDIGFTCYLTLSFDDEEGRPVYFHFDSFPMGLLHDRIADLRKVYNIVQGAVDRFPFEPDVDALRLQTSNLIMPVQYRGNAPLAPVKDELGLITHYSANNTFVLDRIHSMVTQHSLVLTGYGHQKETLLTHLTDNVRDERPDQPAVWRKNPGDDHYFHSMAFGLLARRIFEHAAHYADHSVPKVSATLLGASLVAPRGNPGLSSGAGFRRISRLG